MSPSEINELRRELEQIAADAAAARDRLSSVLVKISSAYEVVSTVRSKLRGHESTTPPDVAQEPGDTRAG
jgi:hypothetical protein